MEDLKENKLLWILLAVTFVNVAGFVLGSYLIDKTAQRVIGKLQKDYSPSPYGPGFDPDKVSPEGFKASQDYFEKRTSDEFVNQDLIESTHGGLGNARSNPNVWRNDWEKDRGFNPTQ